MMPWLTVVMPVHDGAHFLGATLASAAQSDTAGVEFLIYNSADDNGAARRVADAFADQLDIRWRDMPYLPSWQAKTNLGVEEAAATHVAMLHQDDLWLADHVTMARHAIAKHPDAALSIAPSRFADPEGRIVGQWRLPFTAGPLERSAFLATLLVQNSIAIPSPIVRRDAWLRVGGLDEKLWYSADWDFYLKLVDQGAIIVRDGTTTAFRLHKNSLTMSGSRKAGEFRSQLEQVLDRHIGRVPASSRAAIERRARASLEVNCALAAASGGAKDALAKAALQLLRLGPLDLARYVRQSRIIDRVLPRLRLSRAGGL